MQRQQEIKTKQAIAEMCAYVIRRRFRNPSRLRLHCRHGALAFVSTNHSRHSFTSSLCKSQSTTLHVGISSYRPHRTHNSNLEFHLKISAFLPPTSTQLTPLHGNRTSLPLSINSPHFYSKHPHTVSVQTLSIPLSPPHLPHHSR